MLWQVRNILIDSWSADGKVLAHKLYVQPISTATAPERVSGSDGRRVRHAALVVVKNNELCESLRFPPRLARSTPFAHRKGGKAAHNRWFRGWSTDRP